MTRINLLPPEKIKRGGFAGISSAIANLQGNFIPLLVILPLIALLIMGLWWLGLGSKVGDKDDEVARLQSELADIEAKNASLAKYKARQDEISLIEDKVVSALSGRIYWARILNNIAIMCPTDVWITGITGTSTSEAGASGGATMVDGVTPSYGMVTFEANALQCPNRLLGGFFRGTLDYHPDYRPVAGWLEKMSQIEQISKMWLSSAEPLFIGASVEGTSAANVVRSASGNWVISFSSMANLGDAAIIPAGTAASSGSGAGNTGGTQ